MVNRYKFRKKTVMLSSAMNFNITVLKSLVLSLFLSFS